MKKKLFLVFEGPDMCGKSTQVEYVLDGLKKKGYNAVYVKYPVYDGFKGAEILEHLKNFDISRELSAYTAISTLEAHAVNLYVNKVNALYKVLEMSKDADILIVDRFDISQYVYDIAWINVFKKMIKREFIKSITPKALGVFKINALDRAISTHELYAEYFDIKYIKFNKSNLISRMARLDKNRRYDKYDSNTEYQNSVAKCFDDCNIDCFDNNVLLKVDTDKVCVDTVLKPIYKIDDLNKVPDESIEGLVSKYKERVTSSIGIQIIDNITIYLEDSNERS